MKPRDIKELERTLGHRFRRRELLEQALTHSSLARELPSATAEDGAAPRFHPSKPKSGSPARPPLAGWGGKSGVPSGLPGTPGDNEQLEFLGDAVLGFVTSQALFERYPQFREGQLSKLRAYLVSEAHLTRAARKLQLGRYLRLGRGEEKSGGRKKVPLQVDSLEAVLAAMCLDAGLQKTRKLILELIVDPELKRRRRQVIQGLPIVDYKSALQEALHSASRPQPLYVLVKEEGPEHQKRFTVEARLHAHGNNSGLEYAGRGEGPSKKKAEQDAAKKALEYLKSLDKKPAKKAVRSKRPAAAQSPQ
jgi:ribonuclease-3